MATKAMTDHATAVEEWLNSALEKGVHPTLTCNSAEKVTLRASGDEWIVATPTARDDVAVVIDRAVKAEDPRVTGDNSKSISAGKYILKQAGCTLWGAINTRSSAGGSTTTTPARSPVPAVKTTSMLLDEANAALKVAREFAARVPDLEAQVKTLEAKMVEEKRADLAKMLAAAEELNRQIAALKALVNPTTPEVVTGAPEETPQDAESVKA